MPTLPLFELLPKAKPEKPIVTERKRNQSNYEKVLKRLRVGPATNIELTTICLRYGARLFEMRRRGLHVTTERLHDGVFVFTLREQP
jgi:hypothetical protein